MSYDHIVINIAGSYNDTYPEYSGYSFLVYTNSFNNGKGIIHSNRGIIKCCSNFISKNKSIEGECEAIIKGLEYFLNTNNKIKLCYFHIYNYKLLQWTSNNWKSNKLFINNYKNKVDELLKMCKQKNKKVIWMRAYNNKSTYFQYLIDEDCKITDSDFPDTNELILKPAINF